MFYSRQKIERIRMCMNFDVLKTNLKRSLLGLVVCADIDLTVSGSDIDLSFGIVVA